MKRGAWGWMLVLCCAWAAAAPAQAQYPNRPIRLIVPFPPGGSSDTLARIVGQKLGEALGQQVVVDNRPGASGTIGGEAAAKAPPDGYTLLLGNLDQALSVSLERKLNYRLLEDLAPVTQLAYTPLVLTVHTSLPANSLKAVVGLAKARPGQVDYSSAGSGSAGHLAGVLFSQMAAVRMNHVPYKGGAPSTVALLTGEVAVGFPALPTALPYIKSGRLRGLGVSSTGRMTSAPDIPTMGEAGLPGYELVLWAGLFAPAGTPGAVIAALQRESMKVVTQREGRDRLQAAGLTPAGTTAEQFGSLIRSEIDKWRKVVRTAGIRVN
ncbi:MAG: hypothetical protein A3I02_09815 [Betaproteobacteria bacterium RIFCSPLOWO2_02_FULL_67_26]|nr:MAG: hypothetical protein A3I02_09815 [Betaproteobacteria bacterium RIFCSPLOWO2_02_FULL_67_26]